MAEKSKILVIGGTGYIGKFIVEASAKLGHPTFAFGDIHDHESLVKAITQVDVVISTVAALQVPDQVKIIVAIKEAGNVKRFVPSEFGTDVDRTHAVEPAASIFGLKAKIRRATEAEEIPYTYIVSNGFAGYFLPTLGQPNAQVPPRDKVVILGDGNPKEAPPPMNLILALCHSALVKGDATNFEIEASFAVEASEIYPEVKYIMVDQFLDKFA
ncbi:hypothetical protein GH714_005736 [Hevea brasiliensis]|uniref:NmrA-like domain-containing protein n=1 Tax=Hevea brasiliensis TaxID=3981 RepID=A0A6A6LWX7_HEVBR|nr:hypothetical protein GH714_005736 [Hevea brasiliensis]